MPTTILAAIVRLPWKKTPQYRHEIITVAGDETKIISAFLSRLQKTRPICRMPLETCAQVYRAHDTVLYAASKHMSQMTDLLSDLCKKLPDDFTEYCYREAILIGKYSRDVAEEKLRFCQQFIGQDIVYWDWDLKLEY